MQKHRLPIGQRHEGLVDDEALESRVAGLALLLLAHGGPHVGVDDVGSLDRLPGAAHHLRSRRPALLRLTGGALDDELVGLVTGRRGHRHRHPQLHRPEHQLVADVVAVADVGDLQPVEASPPLEEREVRGEGLARVEQVREAVDDGHGGVTRQVRDVLVGEDAGHDAIHEPGEDLRRIGDRLPAVQLDRVGAEKQGVAAELVHPHLERYARPGGGLLEDHRQRLAVEGLAVVAGA